MTKKEWLERCEMVYDTGRVDNLYIAQKGMEYFMRMKAVATKDNIRQSEIAYGIMEDDILREKKTLANDLDGYTAHETMSILTKGCQKCATMPDAWHTRNCSFGCGGGL